MNPNTSRSSAMLARWLTRAVTCCALACSAFWAGNVRAQQSVDVNSYARWEAAWATFYQQWQYWFVETYGRDLDAWLQANPDIQTGTVTNFLGQVDFDEMLEVFKDAFIPTFFSWIESEVPQFWETWAANASLFAFPGSDTPYIAVGTLPMANDGNPVYPQSIPTFWAYNVKPDFERWFAALSGSSNGVSTATTNLLTSQNSTLERVAEYVAGVSNAVGTISNEYETDPTGSNDLPSAETPDDLTVERSVDTSSLEDAVQQTFDGLEGLTPTGSSKVPEITIMGSYQGHDAIKARLDLSGISIATRICKACWAILLGVGVLGVLRSEWDYWSTLGGSAS